MGLGILVGSIIYYNASTTFIKSFSVNIKILTTIFLRLVQMIIAPLVFTTLVVGIAKLGDIKSVGRVGGKAMLWFLSASLLSLFVGLILVNLFHPGAGISLVNNDISSAKDFLSKTQQFSLLNFVEHTIPKSFIEAMATNEILQIVVFSIFFGIACSTLGDYAKPLINLLEIISNAILKMVNYVMKFAPIGVFGALASVISLQGLTIFKFYGRYMLFFIIGILTLWVLFTIISYIILKKDAFRLIKKINSPLIIAFSTTSSEAVFPKLSEILEEFGCNKKIVSFILPLGYSFNLDGSMMYMTFASLAIAQAYNIHIDIPTQITMLLVLMLTSKGIAGVPRASLVVVTATCAMFNIPAEGIALILPIDHFCDMFRSATNVYGNSIATTVVCKWEKSLKNSIP